MKVNALFLSQIERILQKETKQLPLPHILHEKKAFYLILQLN